MLNHPVIRQIREQLDRLKHLENIECVPPMRKDETLGVGITFSVDDLTAARDADAAVIQIETAAGVNYYFDSTIQVRETDGTWSDGEAIWALDLESASSLTLGDRYIAVAVRDEFGNTVSEAQGPYYVSIDVGYGHALDDTAWWIKIVGSLTPASWSGATAYVVGNLVVSGGIDYVCISAHTNHVPPNTTYWVPLVLNDAGAYNGSKAYVAGDYVRELRRLWAFSSAAGGGSAGSITVDDGTVTGPDYEIYSIGGAYATCTVTTDTTQIFINGLSESDDQRIKGSKIFESSVYSEVGFEAYNPSDNSSFGFPAPSLGGVGSPWFSTYGVGTPDDGRGNEAVIDVTMRTPVINAGYTDWDTHAKFVLYAQADNGVSVRPDTAPSYAVCEGNGSTSFTEYVGAWATVSGLVFKGGLYISGSLDVDALAYTPATSSNWGSSPPSTIVDAIDLISTIVNAYIPTNAPKSYSVPGSYDRIISTDGNYEIKCYGGGGGGGGGSAGTGGDGGGGGEYASETVALRVGDVITIVVGDGGAGGTAGNSGVGGTQSSVASRSGSSFTTVSANGGSGGAPAGAGTGGQGGTGSTNTTHTNGGNGTTGNGTNGGTGGASGLQSGAAGGTGSNTGSAGTSGAGGGGGGPTNGVGGAGANGVVIVEKV